jgi:hypothetical protein
VHDTLAKALIARLVNNDLHPSIFFKFKVDEELGKKVKDQEQKVPR